MVRDEQGEQREIEGERGTVVVGSYSYTADGIKYTVTYRADENGFVADGAHFPKPVEPLPVPDVPAVPDAVPDVPAVLDVPTPELAVIVVDPIPTA